MVNTCVAFGCNERANKTSDPSITFHQLPKDSCRRQKWVLALRRDDYTPSKQARLCSKHFAPQDFDRTSLCCVRLRDGAVPSIFEAFPAHLQKKINKRKPPTPRSACADKSEAGNMADFDIKEEDIEIKEEAVEVKQENPETEESGSTARRGEKRVLSPSHSPETKKQCTEVEQLWIKEEVSSASSSGAPHLPSTAPNPSQLSSVPSPSLSSGVPHLPSTAFHTPQPSTAKAVTPTPSPDLSPMTQSSTANVYDSRHEKDQNDTSGLPGMSQIPPTQSDAMESASPRARKSSQDEGARTASKTVSTPQTNKRSPKKMGAPEPPKKLLKVKTPKKTASRFEKPVSKLLEIAEMTNADAEDQYSSFGNHIASQLRELPLRSFIVLQEKIQSLITQERLATIQTPHPSPSPHSYHPSPSTSTLPPSPSTYTIQPSPNTFTPFPCTSSVQDSLSSISNMNNEMTYHEMTT